MAKTYLCPMCKSWIEDGIESLVQHRTVECDVKYHILHPPKLEEELPDAIIIEKTRFGDLQIPRWVRDSNPEEYERVIRLNWPEARQEVTDGGVASD